MSRRRITQDQAYDVLWKINRLMADIKQIDRETDSDWYFRKVVLLMLDFDDYDPYSGTNALD